MELFQDLIIQADKAIKTADHLTYVTYPLVNDAKLMVTIMDNLNKANLLCIEALLQYEYLYKRTSGVPKILKDKIDIFKSYCIPKYNIPRENLLLVGDINSIMEHRKKSPIEFTRSKNFVMCTSDYKMKVLNFDKVKNFTVQTKGFVSRIQGILR
jgi:hypothetical protein